LDVTPKIRWKGGKVFVRRQTSAVACRGSAPKKRARLFFGAAPNVGGGLPHSIALRFRFAPV